MHTPLHAPDTQAWFEQAVVSSQLPVPSQVCGVWPLHCFAPGLHVPEQAPPMQTFVHAVPLCQTPLALHVCGVVPLHCLAPGEQTPVQAPETHAWLLHAEDEPHCPADVQIWTP
jgi:hypothetical protein